MLFDKQKKIVVKPCGMQDVTGLLMVAVMPAVKNLYHKFLRPQ
jgi:hypothetical protein